MAEVVIGVLLVPPAIALAVVLAYLVSLYLRQQSIVFRPRAESTGRSPADIGVAFDDVFLTCASGVRIHAWWVPGRLRKAIVFFHGSDGNLSYEVPTLRFLEKLGAAVLLVDYPGYGQSEGRCSERLCYEAGEAAWAFVREARCVPAADVVVFGQSLGTAVATYLAATRECGGLVFQSGFTSVPEIAVSIFPLLPYALFWVFARSRMNSLRRIGSCRCPVLVLHSRGDEHVPFDHALRIHERAPAPKKFVELRGVHFSGEWRNDGRVSAAWRELMDGATGAWRARPAMGGTR
jgi:pimeloyl-ACP methyl ester carboxylesterase